MSQNASECGSVSVCDLGIKRERRRGERKVTVEDELVPKDTFKQMVAKE